MQACWGRSVLGEVKELGGLCGWSRVGKGRFVVDAVRGMGKAGLYDIEGHSKDLGSLEDGSHQRVSNRSDIN